MMSRYRSPSFFRAVAALGGLLLVLCLFLLPVTAEETAGGASSPKIINVKDHGAKGDGVTDDTPAINAAVLLLEEGDTLYFPSGTYLLKEHGSPSIILLEEKNNITVELDKSATLQMDVVPDKSTGEQTRHYIFHFLRCENVTIKGGRLFGDRLSYKGSAFVQHGYGIRLADCRNATVDDIEIAFMRGDGISIFSDTIGEDGNRGRCHDITVNNCRIHDCQRNGITLTSVTGFTLRDTWITNIRGSMPEAALDIEAEYPGASNHDILIENCRFNDNGHWSITTAGTAENVTVRDSLLTNRVNVGAETRDVTFTGCELNYVGVHGTEVTVEDSELVAACIYEGQASFKNCVFDGRGLVTYRVLVTNQQNDADGTFEGCTFYGRGLSALGGCIVFCHTPPASLVFTDCEFEACGLIPFLGYLEEVERENCSFGLGWALWFFIVAVLALAGFLVYRFVRKRRIAARK